MNVCRKQSQNVWHCDVYNDIDICQSQNVWHCDVYNDIDICQSEKRRW